MLSTVGRKHGIIIVSCRYDSMEFEDMTAKQMYAQLKEHLSPDGKGHQNNAHSGLPVELGILVWQQAGIRVKR